MSGNLPKLGQVGTIPRVPPHLVLTIPIINWVQVRIRGTRELDLKLQ